MRHKHPCVFGEVLFDCFPSGEHVLGGAPFNVAWHLQAFGEAPEFISRVGEDAEGKSILSAMQAWGMRTDGLQVDPELATGRVSISFAGGEPVYDIVHPCAYDAIAPVAAAHNCGLIYHGSLALRESSSRESLSQLKAQCHATVFVDVNLRSPWWEKDQVEGLLEDADWVKLNADEMLVLAPSCRAAEFVTRYHLQGLILTHGSDGAEIIAPDHDPIRIRPGKGVPVVDTVGAGDAFASVMLMGLLNGWPLARTAERAQTFASRMVGQRGATVNDMSFYHDIMNAWQKGDQEGFDDV